MVVEAQKPLPAGEVTNAVQPPIVPETIILERTGIYGPINIYPGAKGKSIIVTGPSVTEQHRDFSAHRQDK